MAHLLATLLAVCAAPATLLLEELARTQLRVEVLSRADQALTAAGHYRLEACRVTAGHHRTGLLRSASARSPSDQTPKRKGAGETCGAVGHPNGNARHHETRQEPAGARAERR